MQTAVRNTSLALATCCAFASPLVAQVTVPFGNPVSVERGPAAGSFGARLSLFFSRSSEISSGFELGYSRLADRLAPGDELEIHSTRSIGYETMRRKMWHATIGARRDWGGGQPAGFYAGGGTGVYLLKNAADQWQSSAEFTTTRSNTLHFGVNLGAGLAIRALRGPGSIDLDARWHVLPFAGSEVRSVFTISAGLSFF